VPCLQWKDSRRWPYVVCPHHSEVKSRRLTPSSLSLSPSRSWQYPVADFISTVVIPGTFSVLPLCAIGQLATKLFSRTNCSLHVFKTVATFCLFFCLFELFMYALGACSATLLHGCTGISTASNRSAAAIIGVPYMRRVLRVEAKRSEFEMSARSSCTRTRQTE